MIIDTDWFGISLQRNQKAQERLQKSSKTERKSWQEERRQLANNCNDHDNALFVVVVHVFVVYNIRLLIAMSARILLFFFVISQFQPAGRGIKPNVYVQDITLLCQLLSKNSFIPPRQLVYTTQIMLIMPKQRGY